MQINRRVTPISRPDNSTNDCYSIVTNKCAPIIINIVICEVETVAS